MFVAIDAVGIRGHGAAAILTELLHWLPIVRPDWKWHVFLFDRPMREFDDPIVTHQVKLKSVKIVEGGWGRYWWVNRRLPKRVSELGADFLFSFANIAPTNSPVPNIVFCQQYLAFFEEQQSRFFRFRQIRFRVMRRQILRGARTSRGMIVQTAAMRNRIAELEPSLQNRIHVIPSGYRTMNVRPDIREEKKAIVDNCSHPRLIYVSHPSEHKNHLNLIRAMPNILREIPTATLLLTLAEKLQTDLRYLSFTEEMKKVAHNIGVVDHIVWLGILNSDEVDYALRSSDLTVFPSLAESFGLGLVESMAAECPIAASDLTFAHDVCGDAASYFTPEDASSIATTVIATLNNPSRLAELKANGTKQKGKFSYNTISESIVNLFEQSTKPNKKVGV